MTPTINAHQAIEILRKTVAGKEDFVYEADKRVGGNQPSCRYVKDGRPSCLVGQAFHAELGFTVNLLGLLDSGYETEDPATGDYIILDGGGILENEVLDEFATLTDAARQVLFEAQCAQDNGQTWGHALAQAEAVYAELVAGGHE
jgi:hypothetical protein